MTATSTGRRLEVRVSRHALRRFEERAESLLRGRARGRLRGAEAVAWISREVAEAIVEGRRSKSRPGWVSGYRIRGRRDGTYRYVWTAEEDYERRRCYVISPAPRGDRPRAGVEAWTVVTVLVPALFSKRGD